MHYMLRWTVRTKASFLKAGDSLRRIATSNLKAHDPDTFLSIGLVTRCTQSGYSGNWQQSTLMVASAILAGESNNHQQLQSLAPRCPY